MTLLAAAARSSARDRIAAVATFDHRSHRASARVAARVAREAQSAGLACVIGRAPLPMRRASEAEWRAARWQFLQEVARRVGARVATAHTRDDQRETVLHRFLRGSGLRGLAGLAATDGPVRPLLEVPRADLAAWASAHGVWWHEDPANADRRFARARLRHDILPLIERVRPDAIAALDALARDAAAWRRDVEALVRDAVPVRRTADGWEIAAPWLAGYGREEAAVVWPAVLARLGVRLDRRGTERTVRDITRGRVGDRMPLAGGHEVVRTHGGWLVRSLAPEAVAPPAVPLARGEVATFGRWRFRPSLGEPSGAVGRWQAALPADRPLAVRGWQAGDRLVTPQGGRRVKRFLAEARIPGPLRAHWPVVTAGDQVVWIPGVAVAVHPEASASGRPDASSYLTYVCEPDPD
jgi:tRNA(Ile)-lysidine synthase